MHTEPFFHDQHSNETFYGFYRKHWMALFLPFCRFIFSSLLLVGLSFLFSYFLRLNELSMTVYKFFLFLAFILAHYEIHKFFFRLISWFLTVVILTDFRLLEVNKGIFILDEKEGVDLKKIQDIQMSKTGILPNLLNYGQIYLRFANILDAKVFHYVPNVNKWIQKCNSVRTAAIASKKDLISEVHKDRIYEMINQKKHE